MRNITSKHPFPNHRWSGWPGAYCHYCGHDDPTELKLAGVESGSPWYCPATQDHKYAVDSYMNPQQVNEWWKEGENIAKEV